VAFDFPDDGATHDLKDQYFFGDGLLVCPMVQPLAAAGPSRKVYLPKGLWYDFWTGESVQGGRTVDAEAGLDRIPVYVKAGTLLVLQAPWEVRVYPGADGRIDFYEDVGDGYAYESGEFSRTEILWDDAGRSLSVGSRRGQFRGMGARSPFVQTGPDGQEVS